MKTDPKSIQQNAVEQAPAPIRKTAAPAGTAFSTGTKPELKKSQFLPALDFPAGKTQASNMKTNILAILFILFLSGVAHAAPLSAAVYDFTGEGDVASLGGKITTLVTANLTAETNLVMLERADLNKVLNEQAFGISGMVSSDAAAKIGQVTGVKVLIVGQVIRTGNDHLVIVANIIGTETARLFAAKVDGAADNLLALTDDLSRKIARTISEQATNLSAPPVESHEERIARILNSIKGKNRPSASVNLQAYNSHGDRWRENVSSGEFGAALLKAGFKVVDDNAEEKPDVIITGTVTGSDGPARGGLISNSGFIEVTVLDRRTGKVICFDHQADTVVEGASALAWTSCCVKIADELAERILPQLAQ